MIKVSFALCLSSFNHDVAEIDKRCRHLGILNNHVETKALVISRSKTPVLSFLNLMLFDTVVFGVVWIRN